MNTKFTRFVLALLLALTTLGISFSIALADPPVRYEYPWPQVNTLHDVCSFDVTVNSAVNLTETDFFDRGGNLTMIQLYGDEQDTFTANGKTLVGMPFKTRVRLYFDSDGNVTQVIGTGIMEKIQLPDGSLFVSAGRVNFFNHPGGTYVLSPDKGNPGDIAAFCAALSS